MAHLAEGVSIATTIVEEAVDTAVTEEVAATTTTIVALATMIVTVAPMAVVTIMDLAESIAMPRVAAMTVTAAVEMIVVVVAANTMAVTAGAQATVVTAIPRPQGILETRTDVEPLMIAQTIGTLVIDLRFANLSRCGALCEIKAPTPATTQDVNRGISESFRP